MFEIAKQIPTVPSAPIPTGAPSIPLTTDGDFEYGVEDKSLYINDTAKNKHIYIKLAQDIIEI